VPKDISSPALLCAKAALFALIVSAGSTLIVAGQPRLVTTVLLALVIWASARAYSFAFYVLERYADPSFRYSGLGSLVSYLLRHRERRPGAQ
jgi:hypothetical protein